jgi:hypothetical protein
MKTSFMDVDKQILLLCYDIKMAIMKSIDQTSSPELFKCFADVLNNVDQIATLVSEGK